MKELSVADGYESLSGLPADVYDWEQDGTVACGRQEGMGVWGERYAEVDAERLGRAERERRDGCGGQNREGGRGGGRTGKAGRVRRAERGRRDGCGGQNGGGEVLPCWRGECRGATSAWTGRGGAGRGRSWSRRGGQTRGAARVGEACARLGQRRGHGRARGVAGTGMGSGACVVGSKRQFKLRSDHSDSLTTCPQHSSSNFFGRKSRTRSTSSQSSVIQLPIVPANVNIMERVHVIASSPIDKVRSQPLESTTTDPG
ncbi:hypothetical protein DFH08DRAFT_938319 [Mycena albidolilacea]|uniref:Uncharacterized protein n=1 Tax=Mycena albidolilacea TaxID=1033008 RepID=A0AAD6ZWJ3_9AGAR|nr:hypothetical protein DFH08DRAFT_938319 [Mycena albidolilacea]